MEIIEENGKDYLQTYVAKIDNHTIDASNLFVDLRECINSVLKKFNKKTGNRNVMIYTGYGANLQSIMNRFSGDFFSPSFLKGFETNEALLLMQNFFEEKANDATAIGNTFHKILEEYYKLPGEQRDRELLWKLEEQYIPKDQNKETLDEYIKGYIETKDYLHPRKALDDKTLNCVTEHRGRANNLYIKSVGYTIPCAVAYVADRIDYRDDDTVILDYKTGHPEAEAVTFDGYLGSMLLYKWAMEQELRTTINKGFLICPGNTASKRFMQLDYSRENEEKMVEMIDKFYIQFIKTSRNRIYKFTDNGYFTSDDSKKFREVMNDNTIWMSKLPIKVYIGEHDESYI